MKKHHKKAAAKVAKKSPPAPGMLGDMNNLKAARDKGAKWPLPFMGKHKKGGKKC